jgi:flagellar basal body-associated protein FliL
VADPKDDTKTLKEIEDSLFEEFNQQVRLTEPTDSRLQNNVDLNPNIVPKAETPMSEVTKIEDKPKVDAPTAVAGEVAKPLPEILSGPTQEQKKADAIALGDAFTNIVEKDIATEDASVDELLGPEVEASTSTKSPLDKLKFVLAKVKFVISKLGKAVKILLGGLYAPIAWILHLSRRQKFYLFLIVISLSALCYLSMLFYQQYQNPMKKSLYLLSFKEVEDKKFVFPKDEKREVFFSPAYTPDYAFVIPKVVANIKRSANSSETPMLFVELIFKASNQETAIEFKDRKIELQDIAARTIEEYEYDTLREQQGLISLRKDIARNVNPILNRGIVIDVLYKSFIIKP